MTVNLQRKATRDLINYLVYHTDKDERFPNRTTFSRLPALDQIEIFDYLWDNHRNLWNDDEDGDVMRAISLCNPYIQALGEMYQFGIANQRIKTWRENNMITELGMYQLELNLEKASDRIAAKSSYEEAIEYFKFDEYNELNKLLVLYCNDKLNEKNIETK